MSSAVSAAVEVVVVGRCSVRFPTLPSVSQRRRQKSRRRVLGSSARPVSAPRSQRCYRRPSSGRPWSKSAEAVSQLLYIREILSTVNVSDSTDSSWLEDATSPKLAAAVTSCWLKKQEDPLEPEIRDTGDKVIWTSGFIFGEGEGIIALETIYGNLRIKLFPDCAPHSVAYIVSLLESHHCFGCRFYCVEGRGSSWDSEGNHIADAHFGPPFALIQGTLAAKGIPFREIPKEVCPSIGRGSVAWLGSGPEFFISLANHDEWKKDSTVFASVLPEDMKIADRIAQLRTTVDFWRKVKVSVLEKPVSLLLRRIKKVKELK